MAAQLRFSRLLAAVLLANLSSLVILNGLSLPVRATLWIYPSAFLAAAALLFSPSARAPRMPVPRSMIWFALIVVAMLTVPRLTYLLEWLPGNAVIAQADDYGRLAELVSMTLSDAYPLRHPSNQHYLLSHYYTALYPMAWLKLAVPWLTLKDCIVLGNLLYHVLFVFSLLEMATRWLPSQRRAFLFVFLGTVMAGLDWIFQVHLPFAHDEHWSRPVFGALREVSGSFTAYYWVFHHVAALFSLLVALLLAHTLRFRHRRVKWLLIGLLAINALYSSVFVFLSAVWVGAPWWWSLARRTWSTRVFLVLLLAGLQPLFLFFGRLDPGAFSWNPVILIHAGFPAWDAFASFALYVVAIACVDLGAIPLMLLWVARKFTRRERWVFAASGIFLASTWAIESIGYNNYTMRGMLLPAFCFYFLAAKYAPARLFPASTATRAAALLLALALSVGTVREWIWLTYAPLQFSVSYWKVRGLPPPPEAQRRLRPEYRDIARDRRTRYFTPSPRDRSGLDKFNAEKMVGDLPPAQMDAAERELLRLPDRRLWR